VDADIVVIDLVDKEAELTFEFWAKGDGFELCQGDVLETIEQVGDVWVQVAAVLVFLVMVGAEQA
jgi:hypothetical protein